MDRMDIKVRNISRHPLNIEQKNVLVARFCSFVRIGEPENIFFNTPEDFRNLVEGTTPGDVLAAVVPTHILLSALSQPLPVPEIRLLTWHAHPEARQQGGFGLAGYSLFNIKADGRTWRIEETRVDGLIPSVITDFQTGESRPFSL